MEKNYYKKKEEKDKKKFNKILNLYLFLKKKIKSSCVICLENTSAFIIENDLFLN